MPLSSAPHSTPKSPAFQFYPTDFVNGTLTFSAEETGVYILLMCHCWDQGSIPLDLTLMSRIARLSAARMRKVWTVLKGKFQETEQGYIQPRIERERQKQADYRRRQSEKGLASATNRKATEPQPTHQPEGRLASTEPQPSGQPEGNSSVFGLPSSDFSQHSRKERESVSRARTGSGVMGGALPRDHLRHSWCGRVCVPEFLHGQFMQATGQSEETLKAFYLSTFEAIPEDEPVEPDAVKFWRPRVAAKWPGKSVGSGDGLTAESMAAGLREARERGYFDDRRR